VVSIPPDRTGPQVITNQAATPVARVLVGGRALVMIAGPCAVEGREMMLAVAQRVRASGAVMLRGGAFKPRTSPYAFQGLGADALKVLAEARDLTGLPVVTEVLDPRQVEFVAGYADVLQVGARNMQNYALLAECGRANRPVLLKRSFAATLDELLMAAEHVMASGNPDVILCERGIRAVGQSTRFTLDVAAVPMLKAETHLPVLVDPSHAAGRADLVAPLALAAIAAGADGLLVEVHPDPDEARSDGVQSLTPDAFDQLMRKVAVLAPAVGREFSIPEGDGAEARTPLQMLVRLREDIEGVDREIIHLLSQRVEIARHAGDVKRSLGVPVVDPVQEAEVLERARQLSEAAGLPYREVRALLRGIIAVSRHAQRPAAEPDLLDELEEEA
jgi:3-deoxy-7-phosphoheptulonate synthase